MADSTNDQLNEVYEDFNEATNPSAYIMDTPSIAPWIVDVFLAENYVIVCQDDKYFRVNFVTGTDGENTFDNRSLWQPMEESWQPVAGKMSNVRAIKAGDEWRLKILGVPFGGPYNGRDSDGQKFSERTNIHETIYPKVPLFYYHSFDANGVPQGDPVIVGEATYDHMDKKGHWYDGVLDKSKDLAVKLWEAAKHNVSSASSGTISHLIRETANGEILNWPVCEISLFDGSAGKFSASNPYAVALPAMKMAFENVGLNLVTPPDEGDNATQTTVETKPVTMPAEAAKTAQVVTSAVSTATTQPIKEQEKMELTEEALQQFADNAASKAIKAYKAAEPAPDTVGHNHVIEVVTAEGDRPFLTLADQARAVKMAAISGGSKIDPRLLRINAKGMKAALGANEAIPADGGYLLEPTVGKDLITPIHSDGPFSSKVRRLPVGTNSNSGWINGVDETSRATGSRWGGVQGYRIQETGTPTAKRPKFRRINWELKDYAVLMYASDDLLMDSTQFSEIARVSAGEEMAFMVNDDILNGPGIGGPLGILNSGALVTFARVDANLIQHGDILKMWQRMLPRFRGGAEWFINSEAEAQLNALYFTGVTSVLSPYVSYGPDGVMRVMGKPVNVTEFNPGLGTQGDILLANMSEYLFWDKGEVQEAVSIHIAFLTNEQAFRFIYRCDGQTTYSSPITPYKGSNTQSAFVALTASS